MEATGKVEEREAKEELATANREGDERGRLQLGSQDGETSLTTYAPTR